MPELDLSEVGKKTRENVFKYTWKDAVLYALGIGAQTDDLNFLYESVRGGLKVFPSYATIVGGRGLLFPRGIDFTRWLHGEQQIKLHRPFPPKGEITTKGIIANMYDKGKAALVHCKVSGFTKGDDPLFDTNFIFFYLGAGGFGGDPGPKAEPLNPPEGVKPDFSLSYKTTENQAALYRLNGDLNPLHIDPEFARRSKQKKPILHGLCTYGFATRAIIYGACNGDVSRFKEFKARFTHVVYPGDTLTTEGWKDDGRYIIQVRTEEAVVLGNAYAIVE